MLLVRYLGEQLGVSDPSFHDFGFKLRLVFSRWLIITRSKSQSFGCQWIE
jgi:hypothetical protein